MSTFHHIVSEFKREWKHLNIIHCVKKSYGTVHTTELKQNRTNMDDENKRCLDVVYKNCKNDTQLVSHYLK